MKPNASALIKMMLDAVDDQYGKASSESKQAHALFAALTAPVSEPIGYIKTTDLKFVATHSVQSQVVLYRDGNKNRTALYTAPPQAVAAQPVDAQKQFEANQERFEANASIRGYNLEKSGVFYIHQDTHERWLGWCASIAQSPQAKVGDK